MRKITIEHHRCPLHKFDSLVVVSHGANGIGIGRRLVGPKSCCALHGAAWSTSRLSADDLREMARVLIEYADKETDEKESVEAHR